MLSTPNSVHTTGFLAKFTQGLLSYKRTHEKKGVTPSPSFGLELDISGSPRLRNETPYFYNQHYQNVFKTMCPNLYNLMACQPAGGFVEDGRAREAYTEYTKLSSVFSGPYINRLFERYSSCGTSSELLRETARNQISKFSCDTSFQILDSLYPISNPL